MSWTRMYWWQPSVAMLALRAKCWKRRDLVGKRIKLMIRTRPILPDPNDEMVLETAINGRADAIVTFNE